MPLRDWRLAQIADHDRGLVELVWQLFNLIVQFVEVAEAFWCSGLCKGLFTAFLCRTDVLLSSGTWLVRSVSWGIEALGHNKGLFTAFLCRTDVLLSSWT